MARHPGLYVATLIIIACGHAALCYPAATCRGYPVIGPFWEVVAPYLMFCAVFVAPIFDDFRDTPRFRVATLAVFTCAMAILFAVASTNLKDARPHIGHLAGYWGVLRHSWPFVIGNTISCLFVAVPFTYCLESVGRGLWQTIRHFRAEDVT